MKKIAVYHFLKPGTGGVYSVVKNLLRYADNSRVENHIIFTALPKEKEETIIEGAVSTQFFDYYPKSNFYATAKKLARLLPGSEAIIIAHDWLELGVVSALGLQHKVIQFIHGDYDYYYHLAKRHEQQVDLFITVAHNIEAQLQKNIPSRKADIRYLRFPVPPVYHTAAVRQNNIIFSGRLEQAKGYHLLPAIAAELAAASIELNWHIAGSAMKNEKDIAWPQGVNVKFYGNIENEALLELLPQMKYFILPSFAEGMPVSLIEAMKAGAIPVTNDIEGGVKEMVLDGITGFRIKNNDPHAYAQKIIALANDPVLSTALRMAAVKLANDLFDPRNNTKQIEAVYEEVYNRPLRKKNAVKIYGSRMDNPWLPDWLVKKLRQ